jgi:hypothetical protein
VTTAVAAVATALLAGYHAHPSGNMAGVEARKRLPGLFVLCQNCGSTGSRSEAATSSDLFECKINGCIVENLCLPPGSTPAVFESFSECAVDGCLGEGVIDCVAAGGTVIDTGPCSRSNPQFTSRTFAGPFPICP